MRKVVFLDEAVAGIEEWLEEAKEAVRMHYRNPDSDEHEAAMSDTLTELHVHAENVLERLFEEHPREYVRVLEVLVNQGKKALEREEKERDS